MGNNEDTQALVLELITVEQRSWTGDADVEKFLDFGVKPLLSRACLINRAAH